jgi:GLPGLI family protein
MKWSKPEWGIWLTCLFFCAFSIQAQKKVSEISITYEYKDSAGHETAINTIYIKGNMVRSETSNSAYSSVTIYNAETGTAVIFKELSGQKILIRLSAANWLDMNKLYQSLQFMNGSETKNIAGYKCQEAVAKTSSGLEIIVFYTADIIPDNREYNTKFKNLAGLPLEYTLSNGNYRIEYKVTKINMNPVPASLFDIPKSGYREMTYEEGKKTSH